MICCSCHQALLATCCCFSDWHLCMCHPHCTCTNTKTHTLSCTDCCKPPCSIVCSGSTRARLCNSAATSFAKCSWPKAGPIQHELADWSYSCFADPCLQIKVQLSPTPWGLLGDPTDCCRSVCADQGTAEPKLGDLLALQGHQVYLQLISCTTGKSTPEF